MYRRLRRLDKTKFRSICRGAPTINHYQNGKLYMLPAGISQLDGLSGRFPWRFPSRFKWLHRYTYWNAYYSLGGKKYQKVFPIFYI